jgi:organic radical activating enzyme
LGQVRRSLGALVGHKIDLVAMELFLSDTCNLRCRDCSTSSPFMSDSNLPSLETFIESLSFLSRVVRCEQLRFLGGEPLLNKDICRFLRAARQSGIFRTILVVTNGLLLPKVSEEFWQLADVVRISVYPATNSHYSQTKLESLKALASRYQTRLDVIRDTHFMKTFSDTRIDDAAVRRIFSSCGEAHGWSCHLLYRNRLYRCSRVHTLDRYLSSIAVAHEDFTERDGLLIDGRPNLFRDLRRYLTSPAPLKACSFCYGTSGPLMEHRQMTLAEVRSKSKANTPNQEPATDSDRT